MKKMLLVMALFVAMAANARGADIYEAEIQSFGNYDMEGKKFYVISANPNISNTDLEFLDYKDYITQCLILKKAILCENSDSADVCVLFDYGVVDKSYVANVAIPIWGITGSTSVTTTSSYVGRYGSFLSSTTVSSATTGVTGIVNMNKNVEAYTKTDSPEYTRMVSEIAERLHLDSLKFAKLETLVRAIGLPKERICTHCFDGSSFYTLEQENLEDLRLELTYSNDLSSK